MTRHNIVVRAHVSKTFVLESDESEKMVERQAAEAMARHLRMDGYTVTGISVENRSDYVLSALLDRDGWTVALDKDDIGMAMLGNAEVSALLVVDSDKMTLSVADNSTRRFVFSGEEEINGTPAEAWERLKSRWTTSRK
jgi:hypothetical protein